MLMKLTQAQEFHWTCSHPVLQASCVTNNVDLDSLDMPRMIPKWVEPDAYKQECAWTLSSLAAWITPRCGVQKRWPHIRKTHSLCFVMSTIPKQEWTRFAHRGLAQSIQQLQLDIKPSADQQIHTLCRQTNLYIKRSIRISDRIHLQKHVENIKKFWKDPQTGIPLSMLPYQLCLECGCGCYATTIHPLSVPTGNLGDNIHNQYQYRQHRFHTYSQHSRIQSWTSNM